MRAMTLACAAMVMTTALAAGAQTPGVPPPAAGQNGSPDIGALKHDAEGGDTLAQFKLALAYMGGRGVPADMRQAAEWMRKAADSGLPQPQYLLGMMYIDGRGLLQDNREAAVWIGKAAEQGYAEAQVVMAVMCRDGRGVPKDLGAAHKWFNLAATLADTADQQRNWAADRDALASSMTAEQIDRAQQEARVWLDAFRRRSEPPPPDAPVRVGGNIVPPRKIKDADPVYPPIALAAKVQGKVVVEVTIAATGRVENAKVIQSVPLLDQAAIDAVKQWEFEPTRLNGAAVPVIATFTVTFSLK